VLEAFVDGDYEETTHWERVAGDKRQVAPSVMMRFLLSAQNLEQHVLMR
jgi:hypothetical protein